MTNLNKGKSLHGRNIIITGGSAGCGWGFTKACAEAGANVIIADINPLADERVDIVRALGVSSTYMHTDVSNPESILALVAAVVDEFGVIDGVINNAGLTLTGEFLDIEFEVIERMINTNLRSTFLMCQAVARHMKEQGHGVLVNVASSHAQASAPQYEMYAATKGGIVSMTRAMAWSLGKYGIRTVALSPGLTRTEPIHEMVTNNAALEASFNSMHATGTFNSVEQLGLVGAFLLSDAAASITGTEIVADQGTAAALTSTNLLP